MTKQSYPSLFTLTIGVIVCNFDCEHMSLVKNLHRQLAVGAIQGPFPKLFKQQDEKTLFLETASLKFI